MTHKPYAHRWWVLLAVGVDTFTSALDGSVVTRLCL